MKVPYSAASETGSSPESQAACLLVVVYCMLQLACLKILQMSILCIAKCSAQKENDCN